MHLTIVDSAKISIGNVRITQNQTVGLRMVQEVCVMKQLLVPARLQTLSKSSLIFISMKLLGYIISASATFGYIYAKIHDKEMLVIMRLNIAAAITSIWKA